MDSTATPVMTALIEAGNIDTVYRDVYLDRARTVLGPVLSPEEFRRLEQERAALAELPLTIARALDNANWSLVKELSERAQTLKHTIDDKAVLLQTARSIYDVRDVRLDPFSPGLEPFTRIARRELPTLRKRTLELLETLERADVAWKDFYGIARSECTLVSQSSLRAHCRSGVGASSNAYAAPPRTMHDEAERFWRSTEKCRLDHLVMAEETRSKMVVIASPSEFWRVGSQTRSLMKI